MPCYHPIEGWPSRWVNQNGKRPLVFDRNLGLQVPPTCVPCGKCIGCRLEHSRSWAVRCMHETQSHDDNCFITLTYEDEHLPVGGTLVKSDYQKFMKRLRKRVEPKKIKFFHCGEYGDENSRPHYHAILFGHDFEDKKLWKIINDNPTFTSGALSELWPWGFSSLGAATFESAAYVARYVLKKRTGKDWQEHYAYVNPFTGEILYRERQYATMSQGIGKEWFTKFGDTDAVAGDFVVMNGAQMKLPKYYDKLYERLEPDEAKAVKRRRRAQSKLDAENQTPDRLAVREKVQEARAGLLPRKLEDDE